MRGLVAVLLATPSADPLRPVAGLTLLRRNVRVATSAGASAVYVVATAGADAKRLADAEPDVCVLEPAELVERVGEDDALVWSAAAVVDRRIALALAHAPRAPLVQARANGAAVDAWRVEPELSQSFAGDVGRALAEVAAQPVDVERGQGAPILHVVVTGDEAARAATNALFDACRKPVDGIVSRNLNRHVSLLFSRRLVGVPITPNQISIFVILIGIAAAAVTLVGSYAAILTGAALFKLSSILDGVDGELARVRWQQSKTGELLDSAGDNLANFAFFAALSVATWNNGDHGLAFAGGAALVMWTLYLMFAYARLHRIKSGDVLLVSAQAQARATGLFAKAIAFCRVVLRRDAFIMLTFLFALAGIAPYMLVLAMLGAATTLAFAVIELVRSYRAAPAQSQ